jgi:hypothetical protein
VVSHILGSNCVVVQRRITTEASNTMLRLLFLLAVLCLRGAFAFVVTWPPYMSAESSKSFTHQTALFGPKPHSYNVSAPLSVATPIEACGQPLSNNVTGTIVLLRRGNCTFSEKVFYAQLSGAVGVVVGDNEGSDSNRLVIMDLATPYTEEQFHVPAVFMLDGDFQAVLKLAQDNEHPQTVGVLNGLGEVETSATIYHYLQALKILSVVLMVLPTIWCALAGFLILRRMFLNHRNRERRRYRLVHIPTMVYKSELVGDRTSSSWLPNSSCAICLDEFEEGMTIKRLECSHAFHSSCIDPWLESRSDLCPICKRSILEGHDDVDEGTFGYCRSFMASCVNRCFPCWGRRYQLIRDPAEEEEAEFLHVS